MANDSSQGPEVPAHEDLLRGIVNPKWWDQDQEYLSSAVFGFPKFSAYVASMTTENELLRQFPDGSGILKFNCGVARAHGFDARHEPEDGNQAHANIYCEMNSTRRKKQSRKLLQEATTVVTVQPDIERLQA